MARSLHWPLGTVGPATAALWGMAAGLTALVALGRTDAVDRSVSWGGHPGLWGAITTLGDPLVVMAAGAVAALCAWWLRGRWSGVAMAVLTGASWGVTWLLKLAIGRPRPDGILEPASPAFPSGHALQSTAVYVGAAVLGAPGHRLAIMIAAAFAWLVGVSRVALNVHHATDVLGGWLVGAALVMTARDLRSNGRAAQGAAPHRGGPPDRPRPPAAP